VAWCIPLLLVPAAVLEWLRLPVRPEIVIFLQLLGVAYAALTVGYSLGLRSAINGIYPADAVWLGIASNGGALALLALAGAMGTFSAWPECARLAIGLSMLALGLLTLGLIAFGPLRSRFAK
jgi:hypothetical protein